MTVITDPNIVAAKLELDALRNIVLLKHLRAYPAHTQASLIDTVDGSAALVILDTRISTYDQTAYPEAAYAALISSNQPALTAQLLTRLPREGRIVFKLGSDADAPVVMQHCKAERVTSFISFTSTAPPDDTGNAVVSDTASEAIYGLYSQQGHSRSWLEPLLADGRAFTCALTIDGELAAVCLAYENYGRIWEVGGVVTPPAYRKKGHGSNVVRTALAELHRRALVPRYQVSEDNAASIALAKAAGLTQFLTITHYLSVGQRSQASA